MTTTAPWTLHKELGNISGSQRRPKGVEPYGWILSDVGGTSAALIQHTDALQKIPLDHYLNALMSVMPKRETPFNTSRRHQPTYKSGSKADNSQSTLPPASPHLASGVVSNRSLDRIFGSPRKEASPPTSHDTIEIYRDYQQKMSQKFDTSPSQSDSSVAIEFAAASKTHEDEIQTPLFGKRSTKGLSAKDSTLIDEGHIEGEKDEEEEEVILGHTSHREVGERSGSDTSYMTAGEGEGEEVLNEEESAYYMDMLSRGTLDVSSLRTGNDMGCTPPPPSTSSLSRARYDFYFPTLPNREHDVQGDELARLLSITQLDSSASSDSWVEVAPVPPPIVPSLMTYPPGREPTPASLHTQAELYSMLRSSTSYSPPWEESFRAENDQAKK